MTLTCGQANSELFIGNGYFELCNAASHWLDHQFITRGQRINLSENLDWLNERLGLDSYSIVRRPPPANRIWLLDR